MLSLAEGLDFEEPDHIWKDHFFEETSSFLVDLSSCHFLRTLDLKQIFAEDLNNQTSKMYLS